MTSKFCDIAYTQIRVVETELRSFRLKPVALLMKNCSRDLDFQLLPIAIIAGMLFL